MQHTDNLPFDIMHIVQLLNIQVKRKRGSSMYVNCPFCKGKKGEPDKNGHMHVELNRNVWRCNRCGRGGGKLALYAEFYGVDNKEAYRQLVQSLPAPERRPTESKQIHNYSEPNIAPPEVLNLVYSELVKVLKLAAVHRDALRARGLSDDAIDRACYRSVPIVGSELIAQKLIKKGLKVDNVPGFYVDNGTWDLYFPGSGILIPVRNRLGMIQGFQIRLDQAVKSKYIWLSSNDLNKGTPAQSSLHIVGPIKPTMFFTEGYLKADVAHHLSGYSFIANGGVTQLAAVPDLLKELKRLGLKKVMVAYDMDKTVNDNVMKQLDKLHALIADAGLAYEDYEWDWNFEPAKKGVDDCFFWGIRKKI